ncbi:MAG: carboxypeptidase-like regulatory domain-containing protein [Saprospiraceae bacterium]|nr:carboxypeptidase-like regulatory domain-containing protein [Saprospiraceae bacterium]
MIRFFKLNITTCFLLFISATLSGQIKGTVTDEKGNPLAFATIYVEGTTKGTVSNQLGKYELQPDRTGNLNIIFQFVGYQKVIRQINYTGQLMVSDAVLPEDVNLQDELVISADREDPAYNIIRKAIQKRNYYKNLVKSYETDLYVKGIIKITEAPEQIMGSKIGNMDGILDTTGQGILYLSESQSKFYFKAPDKTKEIMVASITAGNESLFTANQFSLASFDFYDNYLRFGRSIVSPIADNALDFYRYKLEKSSFDENGLLVNKIKIIPRSEFQPSVSGYIYITEDLWNIHSLDIQLSGRSLKSTFLDTIRIKQIFLPVSKPDTWRLFSQIIDFDAGILSFKAGGNFSYIFSDYKINGNLDHIFNNNERFRVEKDALKNDTSYWAKFRPIPLTDEEERDYVKKDSLKVLWNSKSYLDSMDKADNKLKWSDFMFGYTWNNSYKNIRYYYKSPMSSIQFNAVEGFKLNLDVGFQWSDSLMRRVTVNPILEYGFSDNQLKPRLEINYRFNNEMLGNVSLTGGRQYLQYDNNNQVNNRNNSWVSLFYKKNLIRLYRQDFVEFQYRRELVNSLYTEFTLAYKSRSPLDISTQYSYFRKDRNYAENIPREDLLPESTAPNRYLTPTIKWRWRPGQTYSSYPNVRTRRGSDWPEINAEYEKGISMNAGDNNFDKLKVILKDNYVNAKLLGYFRYNAEFGTAFGTAPSYFADYFHPLGNELITPIDPSFYGFNLLPYYEYSTNRYYAAAHFRHHFNGYIIDKIPLLRKTSLKSVAGISALYQPEKGSYIETIIGLENFRIGPFPLVSIDYTWSWDKNGLLDHGIQIKLSALFDN